MSKVRVKRLKLDLRKTEVCTEEELLEAKLSGAGLLSEGNLYRVVPWSEKRKENLGAYGTDHPEYQSVHAFTHREVFRSGSYGTLFDFADCRDLDLGELPIDPAVPSAILVYEGAQFIRRLAPGENELSCYYFRDPSKKAEALRAIIRVQYD